MVLFLIEIYPRLELLLLLVVVPPCGEPPEDHRHTQPERRVKCDVHSMPKLEVAIVVPEGGVSTQR